VDGKLEKIARSVTIYRDTYGVPHVYGPTDASVVFGFVYAEAEDNFSQIEENYIRALGRAAEVYGEGTAGTYGGNSLGDDFLVKVLEIPRLSIAEYERANPRTPDLCNAVADGLNYYLAQNPGVKPRLITHFEPWHVMALIRIKRYSDVFYDLTDIDQKEFLLAPPSVGGGKESNVWAIGPVKARRGMPCSLLTLMILSSASASSTKDISTGLVPTAHLTFPSRWTSRSGIWTTIPTTLPA
jgi:acyl-homoserine lactone acylase PvdQ